MFKYRIDDELELKLLEPADAEALYRLIHANRSYLRKWMAWVDATKSPQDTRSFIESARIRWAKGDGMTAGILFHGELCGTIDHHALCLLNRRTSIGYWLAESHQGLGIMTRACRAMVSHAFKGLGLYRVEIRAGVNNLKSRSVPERLGFSFEGVARGGQRLYDRYIDLAVYGMLADEWDSAPAGAK
ncbi:MULTISPECIES: GNAT family N-acetyltransferase [Paenibacillus]|uniref:GNAT family N-acetyltransferase n=1 Tax=Paenibacillus TaxID=44249 RepID=UPI0015766FC5|nr:GNAT family protein [Paenibacillus sp. JMULE4]NTZ19845.1 N-acetyltransferase [Paenibacillus sp. JMULE4]